MVSPGQGTRISRSRFLAGGWQLSGVWQFRSGAPPGFGQALFIDDSRKIVLPGGQRNTHRWFNTDVFNRKPTDVLAWNVRTAPLSYSSIRTGSQPAGSVRQQDVPHHREPARHLPR